MRRVWILLLAMILAMAGMPGRPARAEGPEMQISVSGGEVLPGQAVIVSSLTVKSSSSKISSIRSAERSSSFVYAEISSITYLR